MPTSTTDTPWVEIVCEGEAKKKAPAWKRTTLLDERTGTLFVPAASTGQTEALVSCLAGFDGATMLMQRGHVYVPLDWCRREYPDRAELWDLMQANADKAQLQLARENA